jgi:hypothetical protein
MIEVNRDVYQETHNLMGKNINAFEDCDGCDGRSMSRWRSQLEGWD